MCYLGDPFQHDIFVSYAWGDPKGKGTTPLQEWSRWLIDHLEAQIRSPWPEFDPLAIFIDEKLDPTLALTQELREKVQAAGLLLIIMSERWLASSWCKHEIEWFRQQVTNRGGINGSVVVVRAFATDSKLWPDCLKDERGHGLVGICFHPLPGGAGVFPYGWGQKKPASSEYWAAMEQLVTTVINRLKALKALETLRKEQMAQPAAAVPEKPRLYLHAAIGQAEAWTSARQRLENAGFEIEPAQLTAVGSSLLDVRRAQRDRLAKLAACHGLLVLRADPAGDIAADIEVCQADRADVEAGGRRLPCAVLDTAGGAIPEPSAAAIEAFAIDVLPATGPDWLLPATVRGWLDHAQTALTEAAE